MRDAVPVGEHDVVVDRLQDGLVEDAALPEPVVLVPHVGDVEARLLLQPGDEAPVSDLEPSSAMTTSKSSWL